MTTNNPSPRQRVAGVVLAAGLSQRMQTRKQLLEIEGEAMVRRAVKTALSSKLAFVTVAIGRDDTEVVNTLNGLNFKTAWTDNPELGQSESIRAGLEAAVASGCDAILFMPCDLPLLSAAHLNCLIEAYGSGENWIVASHYDGVCGTPLILDQALWDEVRALRGDVGARKIILRHSSKTLAVNWEEGKFDLDTPQDVKAFFANHRNLA